MFGFLTLLSKESADPLADAEAAEAFCRGLPPDDHLAAQVAICAALAEPDARGGPGMDRLRALLALDQRAQVVVDTLLHSLMSGNPQARPLGLPGWQAAFELCRSLGRVHGQYLTSMGNNPKFQGRNEYLPYVALRFFQHRRTELLLRPFVDEKSTLFPWRELHDVYRLAQSRGLAHDALPVNHRHSPGALDTTLEREYIHVLLQDLTNGGHFPPRDALWVSEAIPRWSGALALKSRPHSIAENGFVLDLDADAGISRANAESTGATLGLDTSPVVQAIRDEYASLREVPDGPVEGSSPGYGQRRRVLAKLNILCATERPVIVRRGVREPTALTVEVVVGMAPILGKLRSEAQDAAVTALRAAAVGEEVTITAFGALSEPTGTYVNGATTLTQGTVPLVEAPHPPLMMVNHSDSGCRLHGPTLASNPIVPGMLIAFREKVASPWMLAVVRRVRKRLAGKRVEIGMEYLGRDPRRVIVVTPESESESEAEAGGSSGGAQQRFAALYLAGSAKCPSLPMKTMVLPVRGLAPGERLSVRSRTDAYTIELKEPLDEQAEFVWSPFTILDHRQHGGAAST